MSQLTTCKTQPQAQRPPVSSVRLGECNLFDHNRRPRTWLWCSPHPSWLGNIWWQPTLKEKSTDSKNHASDVPASIPDLLSRSTHKSSLFSYTKVLRSCSFHAVFRPHQFMMICFPGTGIPEVGNYVQFWPIIVPHISEGSTYSCSPSATNSILVKGAWAMKCCRHKTFLKKRGLVKSGFLERSSLIGWGAVWWKSGAGGKWDHNNEMEHN